MIDPHADETSPRADEVIEEELEDPSATSARVDFPCENCGATMQWDPVADSLTCEYCEHRVPVPRGEETIVERTFEDVGAAARGFGVERRVVHCSECGAKVAFEEGSTAELCVYCGSSQVLSQGANRNAIRPESLVPLDLGRDEVAQRFRAWTKALWFRPNALKRAKVARAVGVYVPFWSFDARVHSDWSADAGHYYYVTRTYTTRVGGRTQRRTRRVRKVRWVPAWGQRDDAYDDLLVPASARLDQELAGRLRGFDTAALVPYKPQYLAGWRAEEYSVDLEAGWSVGQALIVASQRERCSRDVPGDTQRNLQVRNRITGARWKHVLLPIWSLQYRFANRTWTVLVNGQNGEVVGEAPLSWWKIGGLILSLAAGGGATWWVTR